MHQGHPIIALIPARGGSKGLLRKNLREVLGKPLVAYTIEAALNAAKVDDVYVSSDDDEILSVAKVAGARGVKRPEELARDLSTADDVVRHFLSTLPNETQTRDPFLVYMQPTSPLRTSTHIDQAITAMLEAGRRSSVSVVALKKSPFKSFTISAEGVLHSLFDEKYSNFNRQELPRIFIPNGAIYIFQQSEFVERGGFPTNGSFPYVMSEADSIDIDDERDLVEVEKYLEGKHGRV